MALFREENLTIQDDYLRVDPSRESKDYDLDYSNDDLEEITEITPSGEDANEVGINGSYTISPDDDDDLNDDDDLDIDLDDEEIEEEDEILDIKSQVDPDDDDDDLVDDDLLDDDLLDDDDLDSPVVTPDLDEDDLLDEDDNDDDEDDSTTFNSNADFVSRHQERTTGRMIDHEPGTPGFDRSL